MFVRWRRGSGMGFVLRGGVTWWWVWHGSDPSLEKTAWRAADGRALQLLITDGAIKSTTCQTCCCLIDRVWLSLYSLFIFLLSWGCEQKALGCFSTVWSCMWLHGHSTVCKHNLTEAQTPTSVHMCTQREVVDCHRQGKDTSKWYSNLYHHRHHHIHHDFTSKLLWQTAPEASIMPGRTVLLLLLHIWALTVF